MTVGTQGLKDLVSDLITVALEMDRILTAEWPPASGDTRQFAEFLYDLDELASPS